MPGKSFYTGLSESVKARLEKNPEEERFLNLRHPSQAFWGEALDH